MHGKGFGYNISDVQGKSHLKLDSDTVVELDGMSDRDLKNYINSKGQSFYEEWSEISERQYLEETGAMLSEDDGMSEKILNAMNLREYCCIKEDEGKMRFFKKNGNKVNYTVIDPTIVHYLYKRKIKM